VGYTWGASEQSATKLETTLPSKHWCTPTRKTTRYQNPQHLYRYFYCRENSDRISSTVLKTLRAFQSSSVCVHSLPMQVNRWSLRSRLRTVRAYPRNARCPPLDIRPCYVVVNHLSLIGYLWQCSGYYGQWPWLIVDGLQALQVQWLWFSQVVTANSRNRRAGGQSALYGWLGWMKGRTWRHLGVVWGVWERPVTVRAVVVTV
jgi:hypothetical protein